MKVMVHEPSPDSEYARMLREIQERDKRPENSPKQRIGLKAWICKWLGVVPLASFEVLRVAYCELIDRANKQDAAIASLIQELNTVRNSIPAAIAAQAPKQEPVRVFRNWSDFKAVMEQKPIVHERKSS